VNPRSRASRWLWALLFAWSVGCSVGVALAATPRQHRALELLVFGLDDDVFSRYGHVAVRVIEPDGRDRVFNFGVTSFNRPGYVAEFLEGRVKFWGKESSWARTLDGYKKADRDIVRHSLRLTPAQADALVARMEHDVLPENREYIYDTFRENCATRLRDYLDDVTGGAVRRGVASASLGARYRDDVRAAFATLPALLFGLELVAGPEFERPRALWERMYHPHTLAEGLVTAGIAGPGRSEFSRAAPPTWDGDPLTGVWMTLGLAAALGAAGAWTLRRPTPRTLAWVGAVGAALSGLLGLLLTVVALGSNWPDMQGNALLFIILPTDGLLLRSARAALRGALAPNRIRALYLDYRLCAALALAALTPCVDALDAPLGQRALAVALAFVTWATLRGPRSTP